MNLRMCDVFQIQSLQDYLLKNADAIFIGSNQIRAMRITEEDRVQIENDLSWYAGPFSSSSAPPLDLISA